MNMERVWKSQNPLGVESCNIPLLAKKAKDGAPELMHYHSKESACESYEH
jgi:hypothetical protein